MASTDPPDDILGLGTSISVYDTSNFEDGTSNLLPLNQTLPHSVPWLFGPQYQSEGFAFWYRRDPSDFMPRRQQILKRPITTGTEFVKHRRTRNGCFTCRNRRVKCDEARPICDRCRKGNRQCEFPPLIKPSKRKKRASGSQTLSHITGTLPEDESGRPTASENDQTEDDQGVSLADDTNFASPIPVAEEDDDATPVRQPPRKPDSSRSMTDIKNKSPSTDGWESISASVTSPSSLRSGTQHSSSTISPPGRSHQPSRWAILPPDIQKYLQYQQDSMTYYHYFFKLDSNDFLHTEFIDLALENDSLLYAAVGFAAYHHTLEQPDGKLSHFLGYYSKAVSLLRSSLEQGRPSTPATFLTILQLATFEEYLGDWVHLSEHHRAAHHLLLQLYTPQTILQTETGRQIFAWHSRFDVIVGLMTGNQTILGREWYVEWQAYYEDQIDPEDVDVENSLAATSAAGRLIGVDMAALFAQLPQGAISIQEFKVQNEVLRERIFHLRERLEMLNDGYYTVLEFPEQKALTSDDIVDPYKPGGLFRDAFWPLNYLWIDWYGCYQMYTLSTMALLQQPFPPAMEALSLDQCRIFEAIERWPQSPKGSLLGCHESLSIAAVFLRKGEKHTMWCRRKMATVEQKGYIFPSTFRKKMAEMWHLPEVHHWWLPNDEGCSSLLREIKDFSEQRSSLRKDQLSEKLRDISAVFASLEAQQQDGPLGFEYYDVQGEGKDDAQKSQY